MPKICAKVVTFKLPKEMLEKLDEVSRKRGVSRSQLIREAIERLLST